MKIDKIREYALFSGSYKVGAKYAPKFSKANLQRF